MKHLSILIVALLVTTPAVAQVNHQDLVSAVKADLEQRHLDLSGPCGAFAITRRVAWQLKNEHAGVLAKPAGNNCEGFSVDSIVYPDGRLFDMLVDSGGANGPAWNPNGTVAPDRWRAPSDADAGRPQPVGTQPLEVDSQQQLLMNQQVILATLQALQARVERLDAKVDALAMQATTNTDAVRGDISAFRKAAGTVLMQAVKLAPGILAGLALVTK